jgi:ABC-type transport system substrate-binding protein
MPPAVQPDGVAEPTRRPHPGVAATPTLAIGASSGMVNPTSWGVRNPMRTATGFRAICLALGLALAAVSCSGPERDPSANGVRGGTLRVLTAEPDPMLDTAVFYYPPIARAYARTLYSYNLAGPPEQKTVPVPDIVAGPPQVSADRRSYTFRLRAGVRYAPPVNREVTATDFITAIQRLYDKQTPSFGRTTPT